MDAERVPRFSRTERWLHWVHTAAFGAMAATGAVLYAPPLSRLVADRPLVKGLHVFVAVAWLTALALVVVMGDRRSLGRTRAEIERFDRDDLLFLRRRPSRPGRFNGGQKAHAIAHATLLVLFFASGALLLLGEHDHTLRLPGTLPLHDFSTLVGVVLVAGHIGKARAAPGSIAGMTQGTVSRAYAARHHPRWTPEPPKVATPARVSIATLLAAAAITVAGLAGGLILVT